MSSSTDVIVDSNTDSTLPLDDSTTAGVTRRRSTGIQFVSRKRRTSSMTEHDCPVCMEKCKLPFVTKCKHTFCFSCLKGALLNTYQPSCPMCRAPMDIQQMEGSAEVGFKEFLEDLDSEYVWKYSGRNQGSWLFDQEKSNILEDAYTQYMSHLSSNNTATDDNGDKVEDEDEDADEDQNEDANEDQMDKNDADADNNDDENLDSTTLSYKATNKELISFIEEAGLEDDDYAMLTLAPVLESINFKSLPSNYKELIFAGYAYLSCNYDYRTENEDEDDEANKELTERQEDDPDLDALDQLISEYATEHKLVRVPPPVPDPYPQPRYIKLDIPPKTYIIDFEDMVQFPKDQRQLARKLFRVKKEDTIDSKGVSGVKFDKSK